MFLEIKLNSDTRDWSGGKFDLKLWDICDTVSWSMAESISLNCSSSKVFKSEGMDRNKIKIEGLFLIIALRDIFDIMK